LSRSGLDAGLNFPTEWVPRDPAHSIAHIQSRGFWNKAVCFPIGCPQGNCRSCLTNPDLLLVHEGRMWKNEMETGPSEKRNKGGTKHGCKIASHERPCSRGPPFEILERGRNSERWWRRKTVPGRFSFRISARTRTFFCVVSRSFPQSLEETATLLPAFGHNCNFSNHSQFIFHHRAIPGANPNAWGNKYGNLVLQVWGVLKFERVKYGI
jgi:hypothetical protein